MKRLMLILPLIALVGCASNVALKDASDATQAYGHADFDLASSTIPWK
jgi:hypothetical protein